MGSKLGSEKNAARKIGISVEEWRLKRGNGLLWCYCCRQWHPVAVFGRDKSRNGGYKSACNSCAKQKSRASTFGMTVAAVKAMTTDQAKCAICGSQKTLVIDHDHTTDMVRDVLCTRCNVGLGQFLDNVSLMLKAVSYLEFHNAKNKHRVV